MASSSKKGLRVPYALAVYDKEEINRVVKVLKTWGVGKGRETEQFEKNVADLFGKKYGILVNSGSSALILAFELLNLPKGSEVITPLLTFSTTIAPIVRTGLIPVFADVKPGTYVIDATYVECLITKKTKALLIPLLVGNVPNMERLERIAKKYNLFFIEDSCDTVGSLYNGKPTGVYTDISVTSFYGSHVITAAGGGGMLLVNKKRWRDRAVLLRGWGRNSSLFGESEDVEKRFSVTIHGIPYDAKFVFDEIGYNFLYPEICAAFGNVQLKKLPTFIEAREKNFEELYSFFKNYEEFFTLPVQDPKTKTAWLAFPLTIKVGSPFTRLEFVTYLEKNDIQTRPVLTGNVLKQPGFKKISHKIDSHGCPITNQVMTGGLLLGCHQGLTKRHLTKLKAIIETFLKKYI